MPWSIELGTIVTRREVATEYGGATQGGIQPSRKSKNIMLYSDLTSARKHGYNFDGADGDFYYYTGEGQQGDQKFTRGNKAILNHIEKGCALRLFETVDASRPGEKQHRYVGEYRIDKTEPYHVEEKVPDSTGNLRKVIVFHLVAIDSAGSLFSAPEQKDKNGKILPGVVNIVDVEDNKVSAYESMPVEDSGLRARREASLMKDVENYLRNIGHEVKRLSIRPPGERGQLHSDTFDITEGELFEMKSSADRNSVRQAVAQLLDYSRFLSDKVKSCTVCLPYLPTKDVCNFIKSVGMGLVVFQENKFKREF
ncbi:YDG/SRA domain-containing protein [Rothia sp. P7208]|uniref:YDG/SRA domain-containing protein n=1 Tax=Rothia sp. P7208 TaxID=3402660 RepID=UPI003ACAE9D4